MYKKFAIAVLVLAPLAVTAIDAFIPKNVDNQQGSPANVQSDTQQGSETVDTEGMPPLVLGPKANTPPPILVQGTNAAPQPATFGMPMTDAKGIDPTPILPSGFTSQANTPVPSPAKMAAQDVAIDRIAQNTPLNSGQ